MKQLIEPVVEGEGALGPHERNWRAMSDVIFIVIGIVFFALSLGYVAGCELL